MTQDEALTLEQARLVQLPEGWTWERVAAERAKYGIAPNMVPIATVPGACTAWGTINSVRKGLAIETIRDNRDLADLHIHGR